MDYVVKLLLSHQRCVVSNSIALEHRKFDSMSTLNVDCLQIENVQQERMQKSEINTKTPNRKNSVTQCDHRGRVWETSLVSPAAKN